VQSATGRIFWTLSDVSENDIFEAPLWRIENEIDK
jgi:hypothetical protein